MKIVVNRCKGSEFNLSRRAYEKLIEWGVPVCAYGVPEPEGLVIFDERLPIIGSAHSTYRTFRFEKVGEFPDLAQPYWDMCFRRFYSDIANRAHLLLVRVVEELGKDAWGYDSELEVIEIPDNVDWVLEACDGYETVVEKHRRW